MGGVNDKHTPYFELRDAMAAGGCALCHLSFRASRHYLDTLNYEGVNDPGLRQSLVAANGFCNRHAWEWAHMHGSALGVALVYRNILKRWLETLENGRGAGRRREQVVSVVDRLRPHEECPACRVEAEAARQAGEVLLQYLRDEDIATRYVPAGGLCLPHLRLAISLGIPEQAQTLQAWQTQVYQTLVGQLDEFIRKQDYRFASEPVGEEGNAWRRAVAAVVGEEGDR